MLTLFLLRHAKSSWTDARLADFERPLAPRGEKAAPKIGAFMARAGFEPDFILCSSAQRTRETLALILPHLGGEAEVRLTRGVYEADDEGDLLAQLAALDRETPSPGRVLLIGHNPAMQDLALHLTGRGSEADRTALAEKFPTATLAVLTFDADQGWTGLTAQSGLLTHFIRPKALD